MDFIRFLRKLKFNSTFFSVLIQINVTFWVRVNLNLNTLIDIWNYTFHFSFLSLQKTTSIKKLLVIPKSQGLDLEIDSMNLNPGGLLQNPKFAFITYG